MTAKRPIDPDIDATRKAARRVGLQIGIASAVLALLALAAAFTYIVSRIPPSDLFKPHQEAVLDVGGLDFLRGTVLIGLGAIAAAIVLSWIFASRAVRPLGEALRLQRAFVANASHELRTPLAVLDARLQALQRKPRSGAATAEAVDELRRDTATLIRIVNELLDSADASPIDRSEQTALGPSLGFAVESMQLLAADHAITISWDPGEALEVAASTSAIHRCVVALLDNALTFSPARSTVRVAASRAGRFARITVSDEGAGIHGIEPARVFERFARGDGPSGGFGIGLALVAETVRRYGGSVEVVRTGHDGTEFAIELPLASSSTRRRSAR